jgi:hypothetical protein
MQDTALRAVIGDAVVGFAGFVLVHARPSKRSASATVVMYGQVSPSQSSVVLDDPTAAQTLAEAQETLASPLTTE